MPFELSDVIAKRATWDIAIKKVMEAIEARKPFSMVRQNDGEAIILGAGRDVPDEKVVSILHHWWHWTSIDWDLVEKLRTGLLQSASTADILGFFDTCDNVTQRYSLTGELLRKYADLAGDAILTNANIHYDWQENNQFKSMLQGRERVIVLSNYDLVDEIRGHFNIDTIGWIPIPGHARYTDPRRQSYRHYPERFEELRQVLMKTSPGEIHLVGAGVVGKIYCHWIKQAGGIALDIGSVFDFWAKNRKRRSVRIGSTREGF